MGSLLRGRIDRRRLATALYLSAAVIGALALAAALALPPLFDRLVLQGWIRYVGASAVLIGIGIVMGFPFPTAVRVLGLRGREQTVPRMWGIDGAASVLGSVSAIIVAVSWGYTWALVSGGLSYVLVAVAVYLWGDSQKASG